MRASVEFEGFVGRQCWPTRERLGLDLNIECQKRPADLRERVPPHRERSQLQARILWTRNHNRCGPLLFGCIAIGRHPRIETTPGTDVERRNTYRR